MNDIGRTKENLSGPFTPLKSLPHCFDKRHWKVLGPTSSHTNWNVLSLQSNMGESVSVAPGKKYLVLGFCQWNAQIWFPKNYLNQCFDMGCVAIHPLKWAVNLLLPHVNFLITEFWLHNLKNNKLLATVASKFQYTSDVVLTHGTD